MALTADHLEDPGLVLSLIMFSDGPFEGGNGFPLPLTQSHHTFYELQGELGLFIVGANG